MIELNNNRLQFRFPEVHEAAVCEIVFQRTLRIPDDNRDYPLPPGLSRFPLLHVDDYADKVPANWNTRGGVFLPMYQAEALWISFSSRYPMAVKVAAGKIDAVTGRRWSNEISRKPQDYVVVPRQPWLDGFCVQEGLIRQFVAMPLGEGYTAEEQLTGEAEHGGLQIVVYPMEASAYEEWRRYQAEALPGVAFCRVRSADADMGLAPGGLMRQEIYEDGYGFDAWDQTVRSRCFVHMVNSAQYLSVTGSKPPSEPPTAKQYTKAGLPWFEYYDADRVALKGANRLARLDSVAVQRVKEGIMRVLGNKPVTPAVIKKIVPRRSSVREGEF